MEKRQYKTSLHCNGCVNLIKQYFDDEPAIKNWQVDLDDPDKVLTVETEDGLQDKVVELVKEAGYEISPA